MRHHQVGAQSGTPCHRSGASCPHHPFPTHPGDIPAKHIAGRWPEAAEAQRWVVGDPTRGGARRDTGVLGREHRSGLRPRCPRRGLNLVQRAFPAECCKGNGQDVGQGRTLPLEVPESPSSPPPKSSNKKSNVSSRSSSSPNLAPAPFVPQSTPRAPGQPRARR